MSITSISTITSSTNPNGTHNYEVPGGTISNSKVAYTHVAWYAVGDDRTNLHYTMHKSFDAAAKASYKYGTKIAVLEVIAA